MPVSQITDHYMATLGIDEAVQIALASYYRRPRFDLLDWNQVTASIVYFGWGAGPRQAALLLQRMLDVADDGVIGPATAAMYHLLLQAQPLEFVASAWWTIRDSFYEEIIAKNPANARYGKGWDNRSHYFTPGGREGWWTRFAA